MMVNMRRRLMIFCAGTGLTLLIAGLLPLMALAQDTATPEATPDVAPIAALEGTPVYDTAAAPTIKPTGNNSYCAVCHNQPFRAVTLKDGNILNLYVPPESIADSIHGTKNPLGALGCVDCHGDSAFPHRNATPEDKRQYTLRAVALCVGCHTKEANDLQSGMHERAIMAGNTAAAVCIDCHSAHEVRPVAREPELVAGICGNCHTSTLVEWQSSPHVDIGPLDCATCHSQHTQTIRNGQTSEQLCVNCHKEMQPKWVHSNHIKEGSDVTCTNCHMYTDQHPSQQVALTGPAGERPTGHSMFLDSAPCTNCHEEQELSGQSVAIVATPADASAPSATATPVLTEQNDLEKAVATDAQQADFVQLLQGLILGLGFGATFAAVFVARGNRRV